MVVTHTEPMASTYSPPTPRSSPSHLSPVLFDPQDTQCQDQPFPTANPSVFLWKLHGVRMIRLRPSAVNGDLRGLLAGEDHFSEPRGGIRNPVAFFQELRALLFHGPSMARPLRILFLNADPCTLRELSLRRQEVGCPPRVWVSVFSSV